MNLNKNTIFLIFSNFFFNFIYFVLNTIFLSFYFTKQFAINYGCTKTLISYTTMKIHPKEQDWVEINESSLKN